jgi:hypothetical protein
VSAFWVTLGVVVVVCLAAVTLFVWRTRRRADRGVMIGAAMPDFTLSQRDGKSRFRLSEHRHRNLLLLLIKSDW